MGDDGLMTAGGNRSLTTHGESLLQSDDAGIVMKSSS